MRPKPATLADGDALATRWLAHRYPAETGAIQAIFGLGCGFHPVCLKLHVRADQPERLERSSVEEPWVAWPNPLDPVWIDARVQEPVAGIHGRLAGANHREAARRCVEIDELVGRHEVHAGSD